MLKKKDFCKYQIPHKVLLGLLGLLRTAHVVYNTKEVKYGIMVLVLVCGHSLSLSRVKNM